MFASLNVLKELQKHYKTNPKDPLKGVIWHTQGSGKTALTYHLTKIIRDFFSRSNLNKKTKFYFIVDRLDLLEQAKSEFLKRGLEVHEPKNKEELSQKLKSLSVFGGMNELLKVSHAINTLKINYNLIRTSSDEKILSLKEKIDIEKISKISSMLGKKAKQLHALKNINEPKNPNDLIVLEDLIALLDFKIEFKERKELRFKEKEEISAKYKQAKEMLEKIPDKQDKEVQKISKDLSKLIQEPLTNHNFDGISHSYSAIISQLQQYNQQTTNLLNKYNNDRAYVITHKRLHNRLMEENISKGIFTLLSVLKIAIDEDISKRQEILNEEDTLKATIAKKLRDAFKENPSLKDLQKEEKFIAQTLFNELPKNYNQGILNA
ncbi:DEAD/DEAH box helicase family protein [Helicobacter pylori]|uniref:DEAD/DEAH box helicase family protein n=1 Tax=Helicobacter pylori TaxID=210 RepID=UPI0013F441FA|nr:DEAD/DEAH box helicase family protein [Helicobacter pylori]NHB44850.1 hypothetical protein [Helicobacter pylori]